MTDDPIWNVMNRNLFFIKDMVERHKAKTSDKFDVYDPKTEELLLQCREPDIGAMTKVTRFIGGDHDAMAPFNLVASIPVTQQQVVRISRGASLVNLGGPMIQMFDDHDREICKMKKRLALGLQYKFFKDPKDPLFTIKIKGTSTGGCRLLIDRKQVAFITPTWKASHTDFFKQGFKYAVSLSEDVPESNVARRVLLALAITIDRLTY